MKTINGCLIFRHPFVFLRPLFLRFLFHALPLMASLFVPSFRPLFMSSFSLSPFSTSLSTPFLFMLSLRPLFMSSFQLSFYVFSFCASPFTLFLRFLFLLSLSTLSLSRLVFLSLLFALSLCPLFLRFSRFFLFRVRFERGGRPCGRPTADCRSCSGMLPAIFSTRRFRETLYRSAEAGFFCLSVQMAALPVPMAAGIFRRARCPAAATAGITPRFADGWRRTRRCCGRIR